MLPVRDKDDFAAVGGESGVNIGGIGLGQRNPFPAGLIHGINFIVPRFTYEMSQNLPSVGYPDGTIPITCKVLVKTFEVLIKCIREERTEFTGTSGIECE